MSDLKQAAKQALNLLLRDRNALYKFHSVGGAGVPVDDPACADLMKYDDVITALCAALTEPVREAPAAYMYDRAKYGPTDLRGQRWMPELSWLKPYTGDAIVRNLTPLYIRPQVREPLTDQDVKTIFDSVPTQMCQSYEHWRSLVARAIEAAHGIKE